jgi:hypothetical protein
MDVAIGYHRSGRAARRVAADLAAMGARERRHRSRGTID